MRKSGFGIRIHIYIYIYIYISVHTHTREFANHLSNEVRLPPAEAGPVSSRGAVAENRGVHERHGPGIVVLLKRFLLIGRIGQEHTREPSVLGSDAQLMEQSRAAWNA